MSIREELNDFKRDKILATAAQLIAEKGYAKTSVDDIASALGATKPFIYYYFKSKADILETICLRTITASNQILTDLMAEKKSATWRLYHIMMGIAELAMTDAHGTSVFFREERNLSEEAARSSARLRKRFDTILAGLIAEGVESREFASPSPKVAAFSIAGMVTWMFTWYRPAGPLSIDELKVIMARLALQAVSVPNEKIAKLEPNAPASPPGPKKATKRIRKIPSL